MGQIICEAHPKVRFYNSKLFPVLYSHVILGAFSDGGLLRVFVCLFAFIPTRILNLALHYSCPLSLRVAPAMKHTIFPLPPLLEVTCFDLAGPKTLVSFLTWRMACCPDDLF